MGSFEGSHKMVENLQNKIYVGRLRELCVLCLEAVGRQSGNIRAVSMYIKGYQSCVLLSLTRMRRN